MVIEVEGQDDYTISFELKLTIKGLNYDPFLAANEFEDEENARCAKAKARAEAQAALEAKRAARRAQQATDRKQQ